MGWSLNLLVQPAAGCLLPPAIERDDRAIGAFVFSAPPRAVGPACGQVGKMVIVDQSARIARRSLGKRIVRYQAEHRAWALQQPDRGCHEPPVLLVIAS